MAGTENPPEEEALPADLNRALAEKLAYYLLKDMKDDSRRTSSLLECVRKLLSDNSVTLASVRRGQFGALVQEVAEEFPFNDDGSPRAAPMVAN